MSIRMILAALAMSLIVVSAPAARADEASKEKIISEMFDVMQFEKILDQTLEVVGGQMASQMKSLSKDTGTNVNLDTAFGETWNEIVAELKTGFRPLTSRIWAKYYTEEELAELLAFYRSVANNAGHTACNAAAHLGSTRPRD